jgi:hypothetical protein
MLRQNRAARRRRVAGAMSDHFGMNVTRGCFDMDFDERDKDLKMWFLPDTDECRSAHD